MDNEERRLLYGRIEGIALQLAKHAQAAATLTYEEYEDLPLIHAFKLDVQGSIVKLSRELEKID